MPLLAFICSDAAQNTRRFVQAQLQHAGNQFDARHDAGTPAQHPAGIAVGIVDIQLLEHNRVVQANGLAITSTA
jgi:hypothetical protein